MVKFAAISFAAFALSACAIIPSSAEPGWSDALLAEAPPGAAPASVATTPLDQALRQELLDAAVMTQRRGETIRLAGAQLRTPTLDTADFVVGARQRARPPEPR